MKSPMAFFTELEQKIFNLYGNTEDPEYQTILRKKNGAGGIILSDFRLYYKVIVTETVYVCMPAHSCSTLATPWTVAHQAPLSMEFSRQEYWSGLSFPSLGGLPRPGIELGYPTLQADSLLSHQGSLWRLKR